MHSKRIRSLAILLILAGSISFALGKSVALAEDPSGNSGAGRCFEIFLLSSSEPPPAPAVRTSDNDIYGRHRGRKLTIWKYGGHNNFKSASHSVWQLAENSYHLLTLGEVDTHSFEARGSSLAQAYNDPAWKYQNPGRTELQSGSEGENFLERNQHFPMEVMQDTSYISKEIRDGQGDLILALPQDPVTFFEHTVEMRESELITKYGKIPFSARREPINDGWQTYNSYFDHSLLPEMWDWSDNEETPPEPDPSRYDAIYDVKIGTSWLFGGQDSTGALVELPLQSGPLVTPIDRAIAIYAWEVGRAAQTEPGGFSETLKASFYFALRELHLLGGSLDKAFIFAHSLNPIHTRMYRSIFGMTVYSAYERDPREVVLSAPLKELAERFPPTGFSSSIESVHEASKAEDGSYALDPLDAFLLDFYNRQNRTTYLETKNGSIVTMRDFSALSAHRAILSAGKLLNREQKWLVENSLLGAQTISLKSDYWHQDIKTMAFSRRPPMPLREFLHNHRAIELQLTLNGDDNPRILIEDAVTYLYAQMKQEGFIDPAAMIKELGVQLAVTFVNQGASIEWDHIDYWDLQVHETFNTMRLGFGRMRVSNPGLHMRTFIYDLSAILQDPFIANATKPNELFRGKVHLQKHLYSPELYSGDDAPIHDPWF